MSNRRKQARPIRRTEESSDEDENKVKPSEGGKKSRKIRKFIKKGDISDNEQNGLLPRRRARDHYTAYSSRNNSKKNSSPDCSSEERSEEQHDDDQDEHVSTPVVVALDRTNIIMSHDQTRRNTHRTKFKKNDDLKKHNEQPDQEDNNNNEQKEEESDQEEHHAALKESMTTAIQNLIGTWPTALPPGCNETHIPSVTLEALHNTKVAMSQFASNALKAVLNEKDSILQDLGLLQSTLITLQQQQLLQMQLIKQLQEESSSASEDHKGVVVPPAPQSPIGSEQANTTSVINNQVVKPNTSEEKKPSSRLSLSPHFASLLNCANQDPNRPLSPGLPPHMLMGENPGGSHLNDPMSLMSKLLPPPPVNTLEVLQKRAQEVLDNASQGLLASSLAADDPRKKGLGYDKSREPFFKHRCRYCGKVFGSDSALQIHIRSHTGERPFKCNVCGSRFTTKGNLKVHFQRHAAKFPHVKMNPHPVPEHLDHFHPPLLAAGQTSPPLSPREYTMHQGPPPGLLNPPVTGVVSGSSTPYRFDMIKETYKPVINTPEDLSSTRRGGCEVVPDQTRRQDDELDESLDDDDILDDDDEEEEETEEDREKQRQLVIRMMMMMRDKPNKEQTNLVYESDPTTKHSHIKTMDHDYGHYQQDLLADQPQNLSNQNKTLLRSTHSDGILSPNHFKVLPDRPSSTHGFTEDRSSPIGASSSSLDSRTKDMDITKDPSIYTNLLPRPGSNDNAWESLIEVTKTSETSKLQQLVDNIEHKLTDPNQCIICHRVLSCKSALQMHYRTHTGERPFKCKICGRAFTTKGNLKTHMGVHRAKPPLRVLHQCPVCHKRFTNSLVLQQHIRLHTGEPTDLTIDQIRAAEVRETFLTPCTSPMLQQYNTALYNAEQELLDSDEISSDSKSVCSSPSVQRSISALESQVKNLSSSIAEDLSKKLDENPDESSNDSIQSQQENPNALDLTPKSVTPTRLHFNPFPNPLLPMPMFNPGIIPPPPPPPIGIHPPRSMLDAYVWSSGGGLGGLVRGNTTCSICLKTFACHSALDIHYRSHTKERPYKCTVCDRGFSTKGNMKQHMLTHKIRDMPSGATSSSSSSSKFDTQSSNIQENSSGSTNHMKSSDDDSSRDSPKRSPPEIEQPPPKKINLEDEYTQSETESAQSDALSKHACRVCTKNFSSTSALQIHMRTHTGDRPFVCSVCQKAFTTKGNLKVHMGTHMWTNGASRRGRRMSLDIPLGIGPSPPYFHHLTSPSLHPYHGLLLKKEESSRLLYNPYSPSSSTNNPPLLFLNGSLQKPLDDGMEKSSETKSPDDEGPEKRE